MNEPHAKVRAYLEIATNIAVLVVAGIVIFAFVRGFLANQQQPMAPAGLQKGHTLPAIPTLDYSKSSKSLIIAMSPTCGYCTDSMPFYNQLAEQVRGSNKSIQIRAIFPTSEQVARQYVQQNKMELDTVTGINFRTLNIEGTPTLILVDNSGKVLNVWIGKLPKETEDKVRQALET
jgi:thiol-disulfide isomerase/thioredoxin